MRELCVAHGTAPLSVFGNFGCVANIAKGLIHTSGQNRATRVHRQNSAIVHRQVGNKSLVRLSTHLQTKLRNSCPQTKFCDCSQTCWEQILVLQLPIRKNSSQKTWDTFCNFVQCEASVRKNFKELMENVRETPSDFFKNFISFVKIMSRDFSKI